MKRKRGNRNSSDSDDDEEHSDLAKQKTLRYVCYLCFRRYKKQRYLKEHMSTHESKRQCELCDKSYLHRQSLRLHREKVHGVKNKSITHTCEVCNQRFRKKHRLDQHKKEKHPPQHRSSWVCRHCQSEFQCYEELFHHVSQNHPLSQHGGRRSDIEKTLQNDSADVTSQLPGLNNVSLSGNDNTRSEIQRRETDLEQDQASTQNIQGNQPPEVNAQEDQSSEDRNAYDDQSAIQNRVQTRNIYPRANERHDSLTFFANVRTQTLSYLRSRATEQGAIKWNVCLQLEMQRSDVNESVTSMPFFRSMTHFMFPNSGDHEHDLNEAFRKVQESIEKYLREGSGWFVNRIIKLEIHTVVYRPISGSGFVPLPLTLSKSNSVLNINNMGDDCFRYCVLAHLHPRKDTPELPEHYRQYEDEIDMKGIQFPVPLPQIDKFENQNKNISVNVFSFEKEILPIRITKMRGRRHHVNVLWLKNKYTTHYCLITDLNRFLSRTKSHHGQIFFCSYCLQGFTAEGTLINHQPQCAKHGAQKVELPIAGKNDILCFSDFEKTLPVGFVIYADVETINTKIATCEQKPGTSSTTAKALLEICGFAYKVLSEDEQYSKPTVVYRGKDAGVQLLERLLKEEREILKILSKVKPMEVTEEQQRLIETASVCCICNRQLVKDRTSGKIVRHHSHLTGQIIGAACNACNLLCRQAKFVPVVFHNLKNFDGHILCQTMGRFKDHKLTCIPQSTSKYISFSIGALRFLDSFQFLPGSLESLVDNLAQDGIDAFPNLKSEFPSRNEAELLLRKGIYPYDYMDSFQKFDETELPPIEAFYSDLKKSSISNENYAHAQKVFETFNMRNMGMYHDMYLLCDVVLLSDVFESFRKVSMRQYGLDPLHFYTSPGLAWSSCLKMTKVRLELLTDIDKLLMIEEGIRGGMSQISKRYEKANNPLLDDYDSSKPISFIQYLDAVNLYGWAMTQPLPVRDFEFLSEDQLKSFDLMTVPELGDTGYILDISLRYPKHLHDAHNCLPLAPERRDSDNDPLPNRGNVPKLLTRVTTSFIIEQRSYTWIWVWKLKVYTKFYSSSKKPG